ncbi:MAG: type II toxin-antitoxin system YoeB family toxin [Acetatifactor sp.]|nr:type II toxin-antitoxin system YoeB family toxin [Acetatifactor sp.]
MQFCNTLCNGASLPSSAETDKLLSSVKQSESGGIGKPERLSGDLAAYWSRGSRYRDK